MTTQADPTKAHEALAARFDTLKEGAPAKIVAKGAGAGMPAASASSASAKAS